MKVCVIGAGAAGLAAIKELQDEGHEVTCYEAGPSIGGIFSYDNNRHTYDSTVLTNSNYFMAFSSLPPPPGEPLYQWSKEQYSEYLLRYAKTFDLGPCIRLNQRVTDIRKCDETLVVSVSSPEGNSDAVFDALALCTGQSQAPHMPTFEGQELFKGEILHAEAYQDPEPFQGKRVVCVGLGETGADIAHEISNVAERCTLAMRRYPSVIPRTIRSLANDAQATRALHSVPYKDRHRLFTQGGKRRLAKAGKPGHTVAGYIYAWSCKAGDRYAQAPVKNEVFVEDVVHGRLAIHVGEIERLEEETVVFTDGTRREADTLICCTGYTFDFSLLKNLVEVEHPRELYKHMLHPALGPRVACIGWARPTAGGIPACSEMQSRYFALLCSGKRQLPEEEELASRTREERDAEDRLFSVTPHIRTLVVWGPYMDSLARLIGCKPRLFSWDLRLVVKLLFGPQVSYQYRLRGPHAQRQQALDVIERLPLGTSWKGMVFVGVYSVLMNLKRLFSSDAGGTVVSIGDTR